MERSGRVFEAFDIAELTGFAKELYDELTDYVWMSKAAGDGENEIDLTILEGLLDFKRSKVPEIWREINSWDQSKKISRDQKKEFSVILRCVDSKKYQWDWADRRNLKEQREAVEQIGKLSQDLLKRIINADTGYVTAFLNWWENSDVLKMLPLEAFPRKKPNINMRVLRSLIDQGKFFEEGKDPRSHLVASLASLSIAANSFSFEDMPQSQIGLKSNKKLFKTFFILRLHGSLFQIFGKSKSKLISNISSVALGQDITIDAVKDVIKDAKSRGEI